MSNYATVQDIINMKRALTAAEIERAEFIIPLVSASLRLKAKELGKDLDSMVENDEDLALVAKSVTVDVTMRELLTSTTDEPMTQVTQSALGYSMQGSYLVPGGGLFIKKSELARLGLRKQRYGFVSMYPEEAEC